ncbi:tail protein [Vibrio phage Vp670]|uniref:Tail protein n=1 Tax=Vibrio phage Vp670 TaxID=1932890 RepID=A0A1L7DQ73_9CAUD|nr:tail protein [Vibrio phage Vp670]APU00183.1 tail protein [Vibrio phage Vp670]
MDINLVFGIDTKIDAINAVLDAIGSVGINSEEEIDWNIDAADADKMLNRYSQVIQHNRGKGWWFNKEEFHKIDPDPVNGYVVVPQNTLVCLVKEQRGRKLPVNLRGNKLFDAKSYGYDMRNLTDTDGKLHCELVVNLPFDTLPTTAKQAITDTAAFWFQNNKEGDPNKMRNLEQAAKDSMISLQSEDARQRRSNMFDNPSARNTVYRAGGYNNVR